MFSNPQPGLILTLHCNWTRGVNPRRQGGHGHSLSSGVIISLASSAFTTAATAPQPAITPTEEHMQAISLMATLSIAPIWDDLYTEFIQPHRSTVTDKCLHVCLAHTPPAPPAFRLSSYLQVSADSLKAGSTSLPLCISVSPHHSGGRPAKAFVLQCAMQQKLHKHADSILLTEGKNEIEKSSEG